LRALVTQHKAFLGMDGWRGRAEVCKSYPRGQYRKLI
jgi:hypothetical protein